MGYLSFAKCLMVAAVVGLASPAHAAYVTEVVSAVESDKALPDIHLGVTYDYRTKSARISREWIQDDGVLLQARDVRELKYSETVMRLLIDLRLGIFRDLELHVQAPIVLSDESEVFFDDEVEGRSTIFGSPNANDPNFDYRYPLTEIPSSRRRAGFGDMTFGLSWSPLVERKDPSFPTLTIRADVITPTGQVRDPKDQRALRSVDGTGDVGLGMVTFNLSLAVSKKTRAQAPYMDPYLLLGTQLPIAIGEQRDRGMEPPFSGRLRIGTAVVFAEARRRSRYSIDLSFGARYVTAGRTYSELSDYLPDFDQTRLAESPTYDSYDDPLNYDTQILSARCGIIEGIPCGELNRVDPHLIMSAALAVHIEPSRWFRLRIGVDGSYTTAHIITGEPVGTDTDPASAADQMCGAADCVGRVNIVNSRGEDERSRYHDPRYDVVGRRLRAEQIFNLRAFVTAFVTF